MDNKLLLLMSSDQREKRSKISNMPTALGCCQQLQGQSTKGMLFLYMVANSGKISC